MPRIVRGGDETTTNDDLRRTGSRGDAKSDYTAIFGDLVREKVRWRGQTRRFWCPTQWYLLTALSSHPADLEIIIIKRSLNQVL